MTIDNMAFNPVNGLRDVPTNPTKPPSEAFIRDIIQDMGDQLRDYINTVLKVGYASIIDNNSGADNIGATAITDFDGTTVQTVLESIRVKLKSTTDNSSGADFVNATAISGVSGSTVQSILESLKAYIDSLDTNQLNALNTHKGSADHDGIYYTESEIDTKITTLNNTDTTNANNLTTHKSSNDHDGRYYTESEVNALLLAKTNLTGNHEGTWQGYSPTQTDPGIQMVVDGHTAQLADITNLNADFPRIALEVTDSPRLQRAIDFVKTTTAGAIIESITGVVGSKKTIILPPERLIISETVVVPSYITIEGAGRHTTILESDIVDGSPMLLIDGTVTTNAFYNTLKGFSIDGKSNICQGIKMVLAHRWTLDDIFIGNVEGRGLNLYESYIGDIRSVYVSGCGAVGEPSVYLDGSSFDNGCHAVDFYGGEIVGSRDYGLSIKYGASISVYGTTIEGNVKAGILLDSTISTLISGAYLEQNTNHIEVINVTGCNIKDNYFSSLKDDSLGHIGITKMYGGDIRGNTFAGSLGVGQYEFFAIGLDANLRLRSSSISGNNTAVFPITIETRLLTLLKASGSIFETDNLTQKSVYGRLKYIDGLDATGNITTTSTLISNGETVSGGAGSPAVSAAIGSIFMRSDGAIDTVLYGKIAGGTVGYRSVQIINSGTTANRPTVTTTGFMYFDTTLFKPIWWSGATWKDATGLTV